ncbi:uncharacterized protein BHQ10_005227 [Talaromyces amestolkiae]|uniref:Integral membrane protein n=1 Tax=Talaromyces amestolkiae TaxID=1196081 RepID=A0A364L094_TALAM|nr:uncharacterized protein BHQ10_005227 [Talaromyces amestolkiae]RAO69215.1 hypothetical protein BHQ10_005227 [Talaromyces amestolkiae]
MEKSQEASGVRHALQEPLPEPSSESSPELLTKSNIPTGYYLKYIRYKGQYHLQEPRYQLKNSLLAAVGFFELANAGDFAANVWNSVPIPAYAIALMAIGGTFALFMTYFAYRDATLSWRNLQGLRCERQFLKGTLKKAEEQQCDQSGELSILVKALLDVNHRETGTEIIDRLCMDSLMGFGATMVGVGTFLAIGGANHNVWLASNLLSGYIGNGPLALYGLANLCWSIYVWLRARRHGISYHAKQTAQVDKDPTVGKLLKGRIESVRIHATLNGITGVVAGAASLVTATMWWGYVVLIPCIIISVVVNYFWRHRLGYDRPLFVEDLPTFDKAAISEELVYIAALERLFLRSTTPVMLASMVSDPQSTTEVIEFLVKHNLFDAFSRRILKDKELSAILFDLSGTTVTIYPSALASNSDDSVSRRLLDMAQDCVTEYGLVQLKYRERFLLEILGCYLTALNTKITTTHPADNAV